MIVPGSASPLLTTTEVTGYTIAKSLRFRSSASAYLSRTPASATDKQKFTVSFWVKRGTLTTSTAQYLFDAQPGGGQECAIVFGEGGSSDKFSFYVWNGTGFDLNLKTTAIFRDIASWYHFVVSVDTTQATSSNRIKIYVNGSQITAFDAATYPTQNYNTAINNTVAHKIGNGVTSSSRYFDGYMADVYLIDGQQLTPSSFGETDATTGVWKPKAYSGTYGTNGFYLKFTDVATTSGSNAGLGKDFSGNGNYWTTNNISVTSGATYDSMKDVPTLTDTDTANYAVVNPLSKQSDIVVADGNLKISLGSVTGGIRKINATIALPITGKYYWESKNINTTNNNIFCGIQSLTASLSVSATGGIFYNESGEIQNNGSATTGYGSLANGDILGMAYDADANKIYFYKNNTLQNSGGTTPSFSGPYIPFFGMYLTNNAQEINFGQRPFAYTPPTGYKALNTYNLPDSTIVAGNEYFEAAVYSGDGSSTRDITTSPNFTPDLYWLKNRPDGFSHLLYDRIRGAGENADLSSNSTAAEGDNNTNATYGYVSAFTSNGISVVKGSNSVGYTNTSGQSYVAWQWQAGQGTNVTNTSGSITSTVSANPTAGFSIVTYTGTGANATVGHGLGVAPKMIIVKKRSGTGDWPVYHASLGNTSLVWLNLTNSSTSTANAWNNTSPTSSVFTVGVGGDLNTSGGTHVAYCWSEISGFSKAFSYTGNGSTDGSFIYLGFRPKWVIIKRTDSAESWSIIDTSRDSYNLSIAKLYANASGAEDTGNTYGVFDALSNGIKLRASHAIQNASGGTYIGMAFAENPFKNSLAR